MKSSSNHFHKGCFFNPHQKEDKRTFFQVLKWMFGGYDAVGEFQEPPSDFVFPECACEIISDDKLSWVGHSTFLIQAWGKGFLTDPIWSKRASPLPLIGPKRKYPAAFSLESLPKIDYVLISHNHYDHLDFRTIKRLLELFPELIFFVPLGLKKWFTRRKIESVVELDWWQTLKRGDLSFHCLPAQHFSNRGIFDRDKTLWCGWMVEGEKKRFYFVGDTSYNPVDFQEIGRRFQPIDLCLIPIGCFQPRAFMSAVHINPQEAVALHQELGSKLSVASHFGTFPLSKEPLTLAPYELYLALKEKGVSVNEFRIPEHGGNIAW